MKYYFDQRDFAYKHIIVCIVFIKTDDFQICVDKPAHTWIERMKF